MNSTAEIAGLDKGIVQVEVSPASYDDVPLIYGLYIASRAKAQANTSEGLTEGLMLAAFQNPESGLLGRFSDWIEEINKADSQQQVLKATTPEIFPGIVGMARPHIDLEGKRWLSNVYVRGEKKQDGDRIEYTGARGLGVFSALLEATQNFHHDEPFYLNVARRNTEAQQSYQKHGFEFTGESDEYNIGRFTVERVEMVHP